MPNANNRKVKCIWFNLLFITKIEKFFWGVTVDSRKRDDTFYKVPTLRWLLILQNMFMIHRFKLRHCLEYCTYISSLFIWGGKVFFRPSWAYQFSKGQSLVFQKLMSQQSTWVFQIRIEGERWGEYIQILKCSWNWLPAIATMGGIILHTATKGPPLLKLQPKMNSLSSFSSWNITIVNMISKVDSLFLPYSHPLSANDVDGKDTW